MGKSSSTVASTTEHRRALPAGTLTLLHDAVEKYELSTAASRKAASDAEREQVLCEVIDRLCSEAHALGLGPEAVVVALKRAYVTVPLREVDGEPVKTRYREVFVRCLRRYFGTER